MASIARVVRRNSWIIPAGIITTVLPISMASTALVHNVRSPLSFLTIHRNPPAEPWQDWDHRSSRFFSQFDYENYEHPRPNFEWP